MVWAKQLMSWCHPTYEKTSLNSKENLAFQAPKCSASGIAKLKYCKYIYIYIFFKLFFPEISLSSLSLFLFSSLSSFSLSHLLSPLFKPKHHPPPNINITHHSKGNVDAVIDTSGFHKINFLFYFSLL